MMKSHTHILTTHIGKQIEVDRKNTKARKYAVDVIDDPVFPFKIFER